MLTRRLLRATRLPALNHGQLRPLRFLSVDASPSPEKEDPVFNDNVTRWLEAQKYKEIQAELFNVDTTPKSTLPSSLSEITLEKLLAAQSHLGHTTSLWHPGNARYIFGVRDGIHVISLDQTAEHLRRAAKVVKLTSANAGLILFVGSRKGQERSVVDAAAKANGYHVFDRWIPGSLTNSKHILQFGDLTVVDQQDRRIEGFEPQLLDYKAVLPDLVVCLNPKENYSLLRECAQLTIPTIGIIDTNTNPSWVTYQIPANDDSLRCTNLVAHVLGLAAEEGKFERLGKAKNGQIPFTISHNLVTPEEFDAQRFKADEDVVDLREQLGAQTIRFADPELNKVSQSSSSESNNAPQK